MSIYIAHHRKKITPNALKVALIKTPRITGRNMPNKLHI